MTRLDSDPTIQSPAGPPDDASGSWDVSLSEIDAMGRKAARGAGLSWGLAEEAGRAACQLAAWRQPAPRALLAVLTATAGELPRHVPDANWSAPEPLCPICTGAALSDRAARLGERTALGRVIEPGLLAPFLWRMAGRQEAGFAVEIAGDICLTADRGGIACGDWSALGGVARDVAILRVPPGSAPCTPPGSQPLAVPVDIWRGLERFARKTYVPASEASRAGAGAGLKDTD